MTDDDFEAELQRRKQERQARERKMRGWLIGVGLVVALVAAALAVLRDSPSSGSISFNFGEAIGSSFAAGLIIAGLGYLALWLFAGRRLKSTDGGRQFGVLLLIAFLVGVPLSLIPHGSSTAFSASAQAISTEEGAKLEVEMAAMEARERPLLSPSPLSGAALTRPGGLEQSRAAIRELKDIQRERARLATATTDRVRVRVAALDGSSAMKESFEEALQAEVDRIHGASAITLELLDKTEAQLDILARNPRHWEVQGDQVAFSDAGDLEAFNRLQVEMQALQARLAAVSGSSEAE